MAVNQSNAVTVTIRTVPEGQIRRELGISLYLHRVTAAITERVEAQLIRAVRGYASSASLQADNPPSGVESAGNIYFSQSPAPRNLLVGTNIAAVQPALLFSGPPSSVAAIEALGDNVSFEIDGDAFTADFDGLTTYDDIASALQVGMRAVMGRRVVGATVTAGGTGYVASTTSVAFSGGGGAGAAATPIITGGVITGLTITAPGSGYTSAPTITIADTGAGTGATATATLSPIPPARFAAVTVAATPGGFDLQVASPTDFGSGFTVSDAANALGLGASSVVLEDVAASESPGDSLTRIEGIDGSFFWVAVDPAITQDSTLLTAVRNWVASRRLVYGAILDVFGTQVLIPSETTSVGAVLSALGGDGIAAIFNGRTAGDLDHKGLSYAGRLGSINFDQPNAVDNPKFLQLPGTVPTQLSVGEVAELIRKRINYYRPVGSGTDADTGEGQTFGTWLDVYISLAWFKNALEVASYNFLKSTAAIGGVPITNQGLAAVADALEAVCEQAVSNGILAPNFVSPELRLAIQLATGNNGFDGFLSTGYLVHRPLASQIDQSVRNARGPIPIKIFAKGSGKINNLDIDGVFEN